jgi:hypothetical protein
LVSTQKFMETKGLEQSKQVIESVPILSSGVLFSTATLS